jgi:hypothetical protein
MTTLGRWSQLSLNQRLARVALSLGLLAVVARTQRGPVVALDLKELATIIDRESDHVGAGELAGWVVSGRSDYRLIDLRSEKEYATYHIPTSENVTLSALPDAGFLAARGSSSLERTPPSGLDADAGEGHRNVYTLRQAPSMEGRGAVPDPRSRRDGSAGDSSALSRWPASSVARRARRPGEHRGQGAGDAKVEVPAGTASAAREPRGRRRKAAGSGRLRRRICRAGKTQATCAGEARAHWNDACYRVAGLLLPSFSGLFMRKARRPHE